MYNQRNNMSEENTIANTAPQTEQTSTVESVQQLDLDTVADSITELLGGEQEVQNNDGNDNDVATDGNDTTDVDENDTSENNESDDTPDSDADENADTEQDETQEDTDENADDEIDGFTPEQQAIFNKAQSKLRKKYQTARADRDRLQSEVESMKAQASKLEAANKNLVAEKTIVENNGELDQFDAMWISSLCDSTAKGKPDIELVDMTSRFRTISDVMEVTTKPIIFDGDTGGLTEHFVYTVRTLERLGVSAVIIEDKIGLKKNSLFVMKPA